MTKTYPLVAYPATVRAELAQMRENAKVVETPLPPPFALPPKSTFLRQAPWYVAIASLLLVAAIVYQVASIPVVAACAGAAIGLGIKYAIDYPRWRKKLRVIQQRNDAAPKTRKTIIPAAYPDWQKVISFEQSTVASSAQVGVSEKFFLNHLQQYFPAAFGRKYPNKWGEKFSYSSDIEIVLKDKGLALQIEIDEPYVGKKGEPHHCSDKKKDADRDRFFLKRGWVVIRFAEEQVVRQPDACCQFIAGQIKGLTGDRQYFVAIGNAETLRPIACWTTKEAWEMAQVKYRLQYLTEAGLWKQR